MGGQRLFSKRSAVCGGWMILTVFATCLPPVQAASYYVSSAMGDDTRSVEEARNVGTPWKTIQRAAASIQPGDRCVIRAGTYREEIVPGDGQQFEAYPGEVPLITGCDIIEGWKLHEGAIYEAPVGKKVVDVFFNGHNMDKARYPDDDGNRFNKAEWLPTVVERGRGDTGAVTFSKGLRRNYVGGFFTGLNGENPYQANMGVITGQNGPRLTIAQTNHRWNHSRPGEFDGAGTGYITDHLNALTSPREWHWEEGRLYFHAPESGHPGKTGTVEARVRLWGFDCSGKRDVELVGLRFKAASILMRDSQNCTIDRCVFRYVSPWGKKFYTYGSGRQGDRSHYNYGDYKDGTSGIHISGSGNSIRNCYVAHGWGALISLRGKHNTAENNFVEEANWQCRQDAVCITISGAHHKVLHNTLRKSSSMLICLRDIAREPLIAPKINYNDCRDYGYVMLDGGTAAIYCNSNDDLQGGEFAYNLITGNRTTNHRVSCGIYLDDGAQNSVVHHNVIHGESRVTSGLFTHRGDARIQVYHNTFWGCARAGWRSAVWKGFERDRASMVYRNNLSTGPGFLAWGVADPITQDHNRENVPAEEFMDVEGLDFRIRESGSASVDAGVRIPGINDDHRGAGPDLGAYEHGGQAWKAGSSIGRPDR